MRWIQKQGEPRQLAEWRLSFRTGDDPNYNYKSLPSDLKKLIVESLLREQGWLCAYTGRHIEENGCHVEHVKAQKHCERGEDVDYHNLVACYPAGVHERAAYGAHAKEGWPAPVEKHLFVSPLVAGCEARFRFNYRGKVTAADEAARKTIEKLRLDHPALIELRRQAIRGTMQPRGQYLNVGQARRVLAKYETEATGKLPPFLFALKQALRRHIQTITAGRGR